MRKIIAICVLAIFVSAHNVDAQNSAYNHGLSFKTLFLDYQSPNGGSISDFKSYHHGFEIGFHKTLQNNVSLVLPFKAGVVTSHDSIQGLHKVIAGLDLQIQYHFVNNSRKVFPYIFGGLGGVTEQEGEFNLQVPVGLGLDFRIAKNAYINWQSEYRFSFLEDRNNLHHGLGIKYLFGGADILELPQEEMDMKDSDGDGIMDDADLCPQVAGSEALNGCPDKDNDGVADYEDACPDIAGLKVFKGCPDTDGDGLSDNDDECPNQAGPSSNKGCPSNDRDGDGVLDARDRCPDVRGSASNGGCPEDDKDNDGVKDSVDKCPNTKGNISADGCPDRDGDGVADSADQCPDNAGLKVYNGCPDSDGDGIHDGRDKCPYNAGQVSSQGCPEISVTDRETLDVAMRAVQFDTGRSTLKSESYTILQQIVDILLRYPAYRLSIEGHTDNTGSATANQQLSERRAKACYDYLVSRGVSTSLMTFIGHGESSPIADNSSLRGRSLNRRTEFRLIPR